MKNEKHDETQLAWCNKTTGVVSQTLKYLGSIRALCDRKKNISVFQFSRVSKESWNKYFLPILYLFTTQPSLDMSHFLSPAGGGVGGGWGRGLDFGCVTLKFTFSSFKAP